MLSFLGLAKPLKYKNLSSWEPQYISLDYWRGIAALWVMLFHGFSIYYESPMHPVLEIIKGLSENGWLGVHIFFVISGYCISASVYRSFTKGQINAKKFLASRVQRLFPVYWLAFLVSIAINLLVSPLNSTSIIENVPDSFQAWFGNIFLIQPYLNVPYYVIVYWSLVVEIGFYLIVASLIFIYQKFGPYLAVVLGSGLAFVPVFISVGEDIQLIQLWGEFYCGFLLFIALFSRGIGYFHIHNFVLLGLGLFIAQGSQTQFSFNGNLIWFAALFATLLYLLYPLDFKLSKLQALKWLQLCGLMSYSIYLLHVPIMAKIVNLGARFFPSDSLLIFGVQFLAWMLALIGSYTFFCRIEKPINSWRKSRVNN